MFPSSLLLLVGGESGGAVLLLVVLLLVAVVVGEAVATVAASEVVVLVVLQGRDKTSILPFHASILLRTLQFTHAAHFWKAKEKFNRSSCLAARSAVWVELVMLLLLLLLLGIGVPRRPSV